MPQSSEANPKDLRNRVGLYMMERGVKLGRNVDPGDVQDMIEEFTQREMQEVGRIAIEDVIAFMQEKGWDGAVAITKRDFASWRESK